jgi:hypothetical protein
MASKKQSRRKLDLTNLAALTTNVTPEPEKTTEEQPASTASADIPVPPQEEAQPVPVEEAPVERRQFDKKPQRAEVKPLKTLQSATNATGEVFQPGDKIQLLAPWGNKAIAEITIIYQSDSGKVWVHYLPSEPVPPNWTWLGGCTLAELLVSAQ